MNQLSLLLIASIAAAPTAPQALGFRHFFKCPSDADVTRLGDTTTPAACLAACETHSGAAGCWWLDGTGGFARECRVCRTMEPAKRRWPNDWAIPMSPGPIASLMALGETATD